MRAAVLMLALLLSNQAPADEAELQGFITNATVSRSGQEFYRKFCERMNDTSSLDFNLAVKERPSARWGILVWVDARAGVEDRQGTLAEQLVRAAGADFTQLLYFALREGFQAAFGANRGVDYVALGHSSFPEIPPFRPHCDGEPAGETPGPPVQGVSKTLASQELVNAAG